MPTYNYPFPKRQTLDSSKLKEYADDNFEFDKNEGKFSERVENTVGKGEIARYSVFKRLVLQTRKNQGLFGKGLPTLKKNVWKALRKKGENAEREKEMENGPN